MSLYSTRRPFLVASARLGFVLALALVMAMLQPGSFRAASASVCFMGADGSYSCDNDPSPPPPTYAPAALVSPGSLPADAIAAASVRAVAEQAVELTLTQHGLPASDHDAALTWARADSLANLWG